MYRIVERGTILEPIITHGPIPPIGAIIRSKVEKFGAETDGSFEVVDVHWNLSGPTHRATMCPTVVVTEVES